MRSSIILITIWILSVKIDSLFDSQLTIYLTRLKRFSEQGVLINRIEMIFFSYLLK